MIFQPIRKFIFTLIGVALGGLSTGQAASEATVDLNGAIIQNGQMIDLSSPETLDAAASYHYEITGTCHGTGNLANFIPVGTTISAAMNTIGATGFAALLSGKVPNPSTTLPVVVLTTTLNGSFTAGPVAGAATADVVANIETDGTVTLSLHNVSIKLNGSPDASSIVFESGAKCVVSGQAVPSYRPDISLEPTDGAPIGDDVYNDKVGETLRMIVAKGSTTDLSFYVANDGSKDDAIFMKCPPTNVGFKIKYLLATHDITADITTTGITLVGLHGGQGAHVIATVKVLKSAKNNAFQNLKFKVSSRAKPALTDVATYALKLP